MGGCIPSKYKHIYLIVNTGKVPDEWETGFAQSTQFSTAKLEQYKCTSHIYNTTKQIDVEIAPKQVNFKLVPEWVAVWDIPEKVDMELVSN